MRWSTQGERTASGSGRSGRWKTSKAQIICIQVVPLFERVEITMSPSRKRNAVPARAVLVVGAVADQLAHKEVAGGSYLGS